MSKKINTFIIGAQKAGTTSLYDWLGQHPLIDAPKEIKDYHFFSEDGIFSKGYEHIESFYRLRGSEIRLHSAVNYLYFDELCAKRIHDYNPEANLIICLRNPVDRAISAYKYFVRTLRENRSFSDAIARELNKELNSYQELSNNSYVAHGMYSNQIDTYLSFFSRNQIKLIYFDDLIHEQKQEGVLRDLLDDLDIVSFFKFDFIHLNASSTPRIKWLNLLMRNPQVTDIIKPFFSFRSRKRMAKFIEQINISNKPIEIEITDKDIMYLRRVFEDELKKLKRFSNHSSIQKWI
ncbi:sulfotransferase family protein [Winogradskyella poriferorum]|uniref:sulfotransferase family protein n=1 Tax=Winogradskyella poriferorum TaxID=307627 RepID=UPI003D6604C4